MSRFVTIAVSNAISFFLDGLLNIHITIPMIAMIMTIRTVFFFVIFIVYVYLIFYSFLFKELFLCLGRILITEHLE